MQLFKTAQVSILSKCSIKKQFFPQSPPQYFDEGDRYLSILHTRLRLQHNALNSHLYKIGVNDKTSCECGFNHESEIHYFLFYFLFCPRFVAQREILFDSVSQLVDQIQEVPFRSCRPFSKVHLLLSGCPDLGTQVNVQIFKQVQNYINDTARFLSGKR